LSVLFSTKSDKADEGLAFEGRRDSARAEADLAAATQLGE
jgi:hypothetical protein